MGRFDADSHVSSEVDRLRYMFSDGDVNIVPDGVHPNSDGRRGSARSCSRCGDQTYWDGDRGQVVHVSSGSYRCVTLGQ